MVENYRTITFCSTCLFALWLLLCQKYVFTIRQHHVISITSVSSHGMPGHKEGPKPSNFAWQLARCWNMLHRCWKTKAPWVLQSPNNKIPSKEIFGFLAKTIHSPMCKITLHPQNNCLQDIAKSKWRMKSSSRSALRWNTLHLGRPAEQDEDLIGI